MSDIDEEDCSEPGKWVRIYNTDGDLVESEFVDDPKDVHHMVARMKRKMEPGDEIAVDDDEGE